MSLVDELSSQVGDRTEYSNRKAAIKCAEDPKWLDEVVQGLKTSDAALLGDCAEVMTMVAEARPKLVAPYAKLLVPLLANKTSRVRWEAMHALALCTPLAPQVIARILPQLGEMIRCDTSVIVRDYAVQAIGNYARTSPKAAKAAFPYLKDALVAWEGKQAGHALNGLANVAGQMPKLKAELRQIGEDFSNHPRGVVRQAAKGLIKTIDAG